MAKAPEPKATAENLPATTAGTALPAFLAASVAEDAGKGVSNDAADNIVPLIYLLQSGSKQCKPRDPDYIQGAKEGDIWLRNSGRPLISGEEGILVQPCFFGKYWQEWKLPRGSGPGDRHNERPPEAQEVPDPEKPDRKIWMMPNGNQITETRTHVVRVFLPTGEKLPYVVNFSSSGHTVSRTWMAMMGVKRVGNDQAPSYACLYRLKVKGRTRGPDSWVVFDPSDAGWVQTQEDYDAGKALYEAFASGEKIAEAEHEPEPAAATDDDAAM